MGPEVQRASSRLRSEGRHEEPAKSGVDAARLDEDVEGVDHN